MERWAGTKLMESAPAYRQMWAVTKLFASARWRFRH
jgi:hypothetical protein